MLQEQPLKWQKRPKKVIIYEIINFLINMFLDTQIYLIQLHINYSFYFPFSGMLASETHDTDFDISSLP